MKLKQIILISALLVSSVCQAFDQYRVKPLYLQSFDEDVWIDRDGNTISETGRMWSEAEGVTQFAPQPVFGFQWITNVSANGTACGYIYTGNAARTQVGFTYKRGQGYSIYTSLATNRVAIHDINDAGFAIGTDQASQGMNWNGGDSGPQAFWTPGNSTTSALVTGLTTASRHIIRNQNWVREDGTNKIGNLAGDRRTLDSFGGPYSTFVYSITSQGLVFGTGQSGPQGSPTYATEIWNLQGQSLLRLTQSSLYPIDMISIADDGIVMGRDNRVDTIPGFEPISLWNPFSGESRTLTSLTLPSSEGWTNFRYKRMNDRHQVIGIATNLNGEKYVVRLDPVPEPATILALSAGLAGILARRRKGKVSPAP